MKTTKVKVQFVQESKKGEFVLNCKPLNIESRAITEISGTISNHIAYTRLQLVRYKAKIKGFSFNRKFNVRIQINELEPVTLNDVFGLGEQVDCSQTLIVKTTSECDERTDKERLLIQAKNRKVMSDFADKIQDMVHYAMTGEMEVAYNLNEAKDNINERLNAVSPKFLTA